MQVEITLEIFAMSLGVIASKLECMEVISNENKNFFQGKTVEKRSSVNSFSYTDKNLVNVMRFSNSDSVQWLFK